MIRALSVGWIMGLLVAILPGPLSITVFSSALQKGVRTALLVGLGGMVFETLYAFAGFTGMRIIYDAGLETIARAGFCLVMVVLGFSHAFGNARPEFKPAEAGIMKSGRSFVLGMILCGSTPTIPAGYVVLAGIAHSFQWFSPSFANNVVAAVGSGIGSLTWLVSVVSIIHRTRHRMNPAMIRSIARTSGVLLLALGVYSVVDLVQMTFRQ